MKHTLLCILFLSPFLITGQNLEGEIIYSETVKLEIDVPEEHREQLKSILPNERTAGKILFFNSRESLYKDDEGEDKAEVVEAGSEESGMHMKMIIERPDNQLYKNIEEGMVFDKQEFFGRDFLVTDNTNDFDWKLTNASKSILGFTCMEAVYKSEDKEVTAWYTLEIPVSNGPMEYGGLPGMILELDIDNGQTHIVAEHINLGPLAKDVIKAPKKGKKVSRAEFDEIVDKKNKELEEEYGSSRGQIIIKHRD